MQRIAWSKGNSTFQFHVLSVHPQWKTPPQRTRKQSFDCHFFRHSLFYFFFGGGVAIHFFLVRLVSPGHHWLLSKTGLVIGGWWMQGLTPQCMELTALHCLIHAAHAGKGFMPVKGSCLPYGIVWRIKHWYITINKTWYSFRTNSDRIITHYNHLPIMACSFPLLLTRLFGFSLGFGST